MLIYIICYEIILYIFFIYFKFKTSLMITGLAILIQGNFITNLSL